MRIWHVSEQSGIEVFEPRIPPNQDSGISSPVVWAVNDHCLAHYLVPRECPRVTFYAVPSTDPVDLNRFFGGTQFRHVVAIESAWLERARSTPLWLYEMPAELFSCFDSNAGYYVSERAARPVAVHRVAEPLAKVSERGVEVRVVSSLWPLVEAVVGSSVAFSCIRMRNAVPLGGVTHNPSVKGTSCGRPQAAPYVER